MHQYPREGLLKLFLDKCFELGRPPSAKEIDDDPNMPSQSTFHRRIGNKQELCDLLNIKNFNNRIGFNFCKDCSEDRETCGQRDVDCMADGSLYFGI